MEAEKKRKPSSKNIHDGHRDRMRERFLKSGFEAFAPHEKIEYLLFACNPRGDTNPLAHELIRRFGSFSGVLDAPYEELLEVDGVGPVAAAFLKMLPQAFRCYEMDRESGRVRMYDYQDMARYLMKRYVGLSQEVVVLMLLDSSDRVIYCDIVSAGTAVTANIYIQDIVALAARYRAVYAVLSHNHPSGSALPSPQDLHITSRVFDALKEIEVLLIDHIIIAGRDFTSLKESGIMAHLFSDERQPRVSLRAADSVREGKERTNTK